MKLQVIFFVLTITRSSLQQAVTPDDSAKEPGDIMFPTPDPQEKNEINYHKCCPSDKVLHGNFNPQGATISDCISTSQNFSSIGHAAMIGFPHPCDRPFRLPHPDISYEILQDGGIYFPLIDASGTIDQYCVDHAEGLDFQLGVYCLPPPQLLKDACPDELCIPQCCEPFEYLASNLSCLLHPDITYTYLPAFYDLDGNKVEVPKYKDFFRFPDSCPTSTNQHERHLHLIEFEDKPGSVFYLQTDGRVYYPFSDKYNDLGTYCVSANDKGIQVLVTCIPEEEMEDFATHWLYPTTVAFMILSIIFLALTILIFIKVPHHGRSQRGTSWNLHRRICVAYAASLLLAYLFYTISRLTYLFNPGEKLCTFIGVASHFFILSAFFWLNSMCFDMVWTISSMTSQSTSILKLFIRYCIYSFGFPSVIVTISLVFHFVSTSHSSLQTLSYATTHCFLNQSEMAQWLFLYGPAAVLFTLNCAFFIKTAVYLYVHSANMTKKATSEASKEKYTFWLYLRLFVIMGITWIAEVLSWQLSTVHTLTNVDDWAFTDIINSLQGFFVFLVFVIGSKKQREGFRKYVKESSLGQTLRATRKTTLNYTAKWLRRKSSGEADISQSQEGLDKSAATSTTGTVLLSVSSKKSTCLLTPKREKKGAKVKENEGSHDLKDSNVQKNGKGFDQDKTENHFATTDQKGFDNNASEVGGD